MFSEIIQEVSDEAAVQAKAEGFGFIGTTDLTELGF